MPTTVNIPSLVRKEIKKLGRKYRSVTDEVRKLVEQLEADERPGDKIPGVGYDVYKVRLPNPSANRGKSGGFRVIYYVQLVENLTLITIYSKTQQSDISPDVIRQTLEEIVSTEDSDTDENGST